MWLILIAVVVVVVGIAVDVVVSGPIVSVPPSLESLLLEPCLECCH